MLHEIRTLTLILLHVNSKSTLTLLHDILKIALIILHKNSKLTLTILHFIRKLTLSLGNIHEILLSCSEGKLWVF